MTALSHIWDRGSKWVNARGCMLIPDGKERYHKIKTKQKSKEKMCPLRFFLSVCISF